MKKEATAVLEVVDWILRLVDGGETALVVESLRFWVGAVGMIQKICLEMIHTGVLVLQNATLDKIAFEFIYVNCNKAS